MCETQTCPDTTWGHIYQRLSVAYFQGYIDDDQAIRYADSAVTFFERFYPETHPRLANSYYNRVVMQAANRQSDQAISGFLNALQRIEHNTVLSENQTDSIVSYWLQETSKTFRQKKDYYYAEQYALRGWTIAERRWPESQQIQGDLLRGLGNIRFEQQDFTGARQYFERARTYYQQLQPRREIDLLKIDQNLGLAYARTENYSRAEGHLQRVLNYLQDYYQQKPTKSTQRELANAHINLMTVCTGLGKYRQADTHFAQAQSLLIDLFPKENAVLQAELYCTQAYNLEQQKKTADALAACQKVLAILLPYGSSTDELRISGSVEYTIKALAIQARLKLQEGQAQAAIDIYQDFNTIVSDYRQRELTNWSQYYLIREVLPVYEEAIELCLRQYEQTDAYRFLEQAYAFNNANKAVVLRESIQQAQARSLSSLPADLLKKETELRQQLVELNQQLFTLGKEAPESDSLQQRWLATQNEYLLFTQELEQKFPRYHQFKYSQQHPIKITEVQAKLNPNQALIEYFSGTENWYAFVITHDNVQFHRLTVGADLNDNISTYHEFLTNGIAEDCEKRFLTISHSLYKQLLTAPLEGLATSNVDRLIFVPDGLLHYVAFESLLTQPRTSIQGSSDFLLEQYACSYHYSSHFIVHPIIPNTKSKQRFFGGFGMEYDEHTLSYLDSTLRKKQPTEGQKPLPCKSQDTIRRLGKLYYSADEVKAIASLFDGDIWLNEQVTKAAFIEQVDRYRILHLALHGSYDLSYPMSSALAFTKTAKEDALLRAWEIYDLDLNCSLVALSACNTSYGKLMPGEGVMTLARAFNFAGVPSIVGSLWSLPDRAASIIMPSFYEILATGVPKDVALQQAKLAYLQDDNLSTPSTRLPSFWGPAIIIGDSSPLTASSPWWQKPFLFVTLILFSIGLYRYVKR